MKRLRADWAKQSVDAKQYWNQQAAMNGLLSGYNAFIQFWFRTIARASDRALMLPLNENHGVTVYDLSSHMTTASLKNYASGADISWTQGKNHILGPALNFPGFGTVVELAETEHLATQQFTLEAWIKATAIDPGVDTIYCIDKYPYGLWLNISSTMNINAAIGDGSELQILQSTTQPQPSEWYHIAITGDSSHFKLYINSVLENEFNATLTYSASNPPAALGASKIITNYSNYFNGLINHVAAYSRVLTQEEINANFSRFNSA